MKVFCSIFRSKKKTKANNKKKKGDKKTREPSSHLHISLSESKLIIVCVKKCVTCPEKIILGIFYVSGGSESFLQFICDTSFLR